MQVPLENLPTESWISSWMTRRWMRKHRILTRACRTRTSVAAPAVVMKFVFVCLETDHTKCEVAAESSLQEFLRRTDNMSLLPL
jgi:hypothetical protein